MGGEGKFFRRYGMKKKIDVILKGESILVDGELISGALTIDKGIITGIFTGDLDVEAEQVIVAGSHLVLPGLVDPHVHLRDPGHPERESFTSGTMAAAAGGITTICEHPISLPPPYSPAILKRRKEVARKQAVVDYAFLGAAGAEFLEEIEPLSKEGIVAYKTFLQPPEPGREKEFQGLTMKNDGEVLRGFQHMAATGLPCVIHAENHAIIQDLIKEYQGKNHISSLYHAWSRPPISETEIVSRMIQFARATGLSILIAHISLPESVDMITLAKEEGLSVYAETCPHYLFLQEEHLAEWGPYAKCNPPLRTVAANRGLWHQLQSGAIDIIGSDHSPFLPQEKERGWENIFAAPAGLPLMECSLPLMLTQVKRGRISLSQMMQLTAENPAVIYGLYPQKGAIKIGSHADIIVVDMERPYRINNSSFFTQARECARVYQGWEVYGRVIQTLVRGKTVFQNGSIATDAKGWGSLVRPSGTNLL